MTIWEARIGLLGVAEVTNDALPMLETAMQTAFLELTGEPAEFVFTSVAKELSPTQKIIQKATNPVTAFDIKIGVRGYARVPDGGDWPMRVACREAFFKVMRTGADYLYSGWGGSLTEEQIKQFPQG